MLIIFSWTWIIYTLWVWACMCEQVLLGFVHGCTYVCLCARLHMATAAPSVCAETLSINRAGVGGGYRTTGSYLLSQHAPLLSRLAFPGWEPGELSSCTAIRVCVCVWGQESTFKNPDELIILFENIYAFTDRQVCVLFTYTLLPDMFMAVPSSCPLIFLFHWQDTGKRRKGELEGGMTVCFKEELKRGRRHRYVSQLPCVCPPSSQSQAFVYLGMFLLSGSSLLLVWTRYSTKHSQTLGRQCSNPDFPYPTVHEPRR